MAFRGMANAALVCFFGLTACSVTPDSSGSSFTTLTATAGATVTASTTDATTGAATDTSDPTTGGSDVTSGGPSSSSDTASECGNNIVEGGENCDGVDLADQTCADFGWSDGTLLCGAECNLNTDACFSCGDNSKDPMETCDGTDFGGLSCTSEGFGGGALACAADCLSIDTSGCTALPSCGDGTLNGGEQCEGADLSGQTCVTLGWDMGNLLCNADCTFNQGGCENDLSNCAGMGEPCIFDPNDPKSNCCPAGEKGNVLGICDIIVCL
jgi:hypothetical protein